MAVFEPDTYLRAIRGISSRCHGSRYELLISLIRYFMAVTFIASGLLKALSPDATSQMITQYLNLLGITSFGLSTKFIAVSLCLAEMLIGIIALAKRWFYIVAPMYVVIMLFFTFITYINLTSPYGSYESCGCFGEIIHLNALETFIKNLFLLSFSLLLCAHYIKSKC